MLTNLETEIDAVFSAALRGEAASWPFEEDDPACTEVALRRMHLHGIAGILNAQIERLEGWPSALIEAMKSESLVRTMWELRHGLVLREAISRLRDTGVSSILLKGTALAYSHYSQPSLRFRGDSDLLVGAIDLERARATLRGLGWSCMAQATGLFGSIHFQEIWRLVDRAGLVHDIDLHWQVTNSMALKYVLDADLAFQSAIPLPALFCQAQCMDAVTALIHRAVNREEHAASGYFSLDRNEFVADRLIWACDLDLLMRSLTAVQWTELVSRTLRTGIASIIRDALQFATSRLASPIPEQVLAKLSESVAETPATRFLRGGTLYRAWADVIALPGATSKLRYLLARAFPASAHVRAKYPGKSAWPLPILYIHRLIGGISRRNAKASR